MNTIENKISRHYADKDMLSRIYNALSETGHDLDNLQPEDLMPVEEFHIGGRESTVYAVSKMDLKPEYRVLDIGCGIGGAARYIASHHGCKVDGIDLTPEYIDCGNDLSKSVRLNGKVHLEVASALDIPFPDGIFDAAITLHVAMNIEDREQLYRETARVLKSGAVLCIYDVMKIGKKPLEYPVPWAKTAETSFLKTPEQMQILLEGAGFSITKMENRVEVAKSFFKKQLLAQKASKSDKPPVLGVHLIIREQAKEKFENTQLNIDLELMAPVLMFAVKN